MERIGSYIPNESPVAMAPKADITSFNKVRRHSDDGNTSTSKKSNQSGKKMTRSVSTPQSERRSEGASSSHVDDGPGSNTKNKIWRLIMANISRSVDELYYLCEDERDEQKCREIISFLREQDMTSTNSSNELGSSESLRAVRHPG